MLASTAFQKRIQNDINCEDNNACILVFPILTLQWVYGMQYVPVGEIVLADFQPQDPKYMQG